MRHDGYEDPHTLEPVPADAGPDDDDATFRLPYPEEAAKNSDGSYQYRVYDAKSLWRWVRERRPPIDPVSKVPLLKRDWEELRDRYSDAVTDPTPSDRNFRRPITNGLWPPRLNNYNIRPAVQEAVRAGWPDYRHPVFGPIAQWDVSGVTDMSYLFIDAEFNGDVRGWKVHNVTNMSRMFCGTKFFDRDLTDWEVSNVTNMGQMFFGARDFNGDISAWNVGKVKDMHRMFSQARKFNQNLNQWNVVNVTNMYGMFERATAFDGDISDWKMRSVTDTSWMFAEARAFGSREGGGD